MNRYTHLISIIILFASCFTHAADNTQEPCIKKYGADYMPPSLPDSVSVKNAIALVEFTYCHTKKTSESIVIILPTFPCLGIRIYKAEDTEESVSAHLHSANSPDWFAKKTKKLFGNLSEKPAIELIIFTRSNHDELKGYPFKEKSHRARIQKVYDVMNIHFTIKIAVIFFNETETPKNSLVLEDRSIIFIGKALYRFDPLTRPIIGYGYRLQSYQENIMLQRHGQRLWCSHPATIWGCFNVPLCCVKKNNLSTINKIPAQSSDPLQKYLTQKEIPHYKHQ